MKKSILPVFAFILLASAACDRGADQSGTAVQEHNNQTNTDSMSPDSSRSQDGSAVGVTPDSPSQQPGTVGEPNGTDTDAMTNDEAATANPDGTAPTQQ